MKSAFLKKKLTEEQEINFFKYLKPKVTSKIIFYKELLIIENNKPLGTEKSIRKYYLIQLKKKELFFAENHDFLCYHRNDANYLDQNYFLRTQNLNVSSQAELNFFQMDPLFNTSHDFKVGQLLAYQQLHKYLEEKINIKPNKFSNNNIRNKLKWTGSKVGLVELIYALHTEGVFNDGFCDLAEITKTFSVAFDIEIKQIHRIFYEICNRKSEQTKFINLLKTRLEKKIEQMDIT